MFNHTVTIYNRYINNITKDYAYKRTVIAGVHWENTENVKLGNQSVKTDNNTCLIIPCTVKNIKDYVNPSVFKNNPTGEIWTLQTEDIVVKGVVNFDIMSVADLKGYCAKTIHSIEEVDYASITTLNNWTVGLR